MLATVIVYGSKLGDSSMSWYLFSTGSVEVVDGKSPSFLITFTFPLSQIDDDLTARISMADAKFSFQERGKIYSPQWFSPEGNE